MLAELYVIKGREAGKALELSPGSAVSFGRALSNDVRVRDAAVSRVHCRFECTEAAVRLKDMSGNGTFVNDDRIKGVEVALRDGDTIRLGATEIRVLIESEEEAEVRAELESEREEPNEDSAPNLSESTTDDMVRSGSNNARRLGQPKITLAELDEIKKARAQKKTNTPPPPTSIEMIELDEEDEDDGEDEKGRKSDDENENENESEGENEAETESTEGIPVPRAAKPAPKPAAPTIITPLPPRAPRKPLPTETGSQLREVIPGYRIEAKLGGGGRRGTVVYKATQLSLDRPVALKVLLPTAAASEKDLGRFLREAAAVARLPHPNIVTVHDAGRAGERRFIVMELLPGGSAADRIEDQGKLPLDEGLALVLDATRGLAFAHQRGVIHRSVRPANVLRDAAGVWKLVDFGLARDVMRGGGGDTSFIDGPLEAVAYLAPEQVEEAEVDARSDVYSIGSLLYHALVGEPPYWADSIGLIASRIGTEPAMEPFAAVAPASLAAIVRRCLARSPEERYQDGQTLLHELAAAAAQIKPGSRTPSRGVRAP